MKTAVVGCGAISDIYLQNMINKFENIEVVACCAKHFENAQKKAAKYGIRACTYEEILEDTDIEMVVVLTPASTHYELIKQALSAGKHVYTEKTMTVTTQEATELIALAKEKNRYLGSAPDTFLGAALQTARKAIDDGVIGEVTSFQISANRDLGYLAGLYTFLQLPGGGICADYGVYHLTALVSLLGSVDRVSAIVKNKSTVRTVVVKESPNYGKEYEYPNESQVVSLLELENGIAGSLSLNGDSVLEDICDFKIYGTKGIMVLPDPNQFGGYVRVIPNNYEGKKEIICLEPVSSYGENCRGIGPAEMVSAIENGKENRANTEMAYHVMDIISQMMKSSEKECFVKVESTCERPEPFVKIL